MELRNLSAVVNSGGASGVVSTTGGDREEAERYGN